MLTFPAGRRDELHRVVIGKNSHFRIASSAGEHVADIDDVVPSPDLVVHAASATTCVQQDHRIVIPRVIVEINLVSSETRSNTPPEAVKELELIDHHRA